MDAIAANQQLIHNFYTAFAQKNYAAMQQSYAPNAVFTDEVFTNLNSAQVKAMWEMLCKRGKDLELQFSNVQATPTGGTAYWQATYTLSSTGRKVTNRINATFEIADGKIVKHTDRFSFYAWAKQAFGITGWLLGGTSFFKKKVQAKAKEGLNAFMQKQ